MNYYYYYKRRKCVCKVTQGAVFALTYGAEKVTVLFFNAFKKGCMIDYDVNVS